MPTADLHNDSILRAPVIYSVVVPVYNSAAVLGRLYGRLMTVMKVLGRRFELVFVDDGSVDASWSLLAEIARTDPRVTAIRLARNVGQSEATLVGLRVSSGEILITIDDDLLHARRNPESARRAGRSRTLRCDIRCARNATASWMAQSCELDHQYVCQSGDWKTGVAAVHRVIRRPAVERMLELSWPDPFVSALLFQVTRRIAAVRVTHFPSALKSSRYSLRKLARVPAGLFGALSDADRRSLVRFVGIIGVILVVLTYAGFAFWDAGIMMGILAAAAGMLAVLALSFAIAALLLERRVAAFRREPVAAIGIQAMISGGQETTDNV
jgi:polyisoprenyl-phosphate glycosyltransferase